MAITLLCEGKDERAVFAWLLHLRGLGDVESVPFGNMLKASSDFHLVREQANRPEGEGVGWVLRKLPAVLPNVARLGVVLDADDELQSRWDSLRARVQGVANDNPHVSFDDLPAAPPSEGYIGASSDKRVLGVWIMPDNRSSGSLETLLSGVVPGGPNWDLAGAVLRDVSEPRFRSVDQPKARLHTWLAWQDPPGHKYGTAIEVGLISPDHAIFSPFMDWLTRLKEFQP